MPATSRSPCELYPAGGRWVSGIPGFGVGGAKQKQTNDAADNARTAEKRHRTTGGEQRGNARVFGEKRGGRVCEIGVFGRGRGSQGSSCVKQGAINLGSRDDLRCLLRPVRDCIDRLLDPSPLEAEPDILEAVVADVLCDFCVRVLRLSRIW